MKFKDANEQATYASLLAKIERQLGATVTANAVSLADVILRMDPSLLPIAALAEATQYASHGGLLGALRNSNNEDRRLARSYGMTLCEVRSGMGLRIRQIWNALKQELH